MILALLACGEPCSGEPYVAMQEDFVDYERWHTFPIEAPDVRLGTGDRTVYASDLPAEDGRFPVCTRIVKTGATTGDPTTWLMVGMAKRGDGYNADGAVGWEWFDLDPDSDGVPWIDWRGPVPPEGSGYECALGEDEGGADSIGDCNVCHAVPSSVDAVLSFEHWDL